MKKLLCFLLCLTMIFSSVSLCFASATTWDTSDQANLRYIMQSLTSPTGTVVSILNTISTRTNNIYNKCVDIYNALFDDGKSVAYWVSAILTWMSPILTAIQQTPLDLEKIWLSLGYTTDIDNDGNLEYHSYLNSLNDSLTNSGDTSNSYRNWAHSQLVNSNGQYSYNFPGNNGSIVTRQIGWYNGTPLGNIALLLQDSIQATTSAYRYNYYANSNGYNNSQNAVNWYNLGTSSFTPTSAIDGIYKWFSSIQAPVARLSYVLASDERIEAQEAAAANEEAVVDNFIDSSGDGAASPSDIGSVSNLSSGYKQNFGSDASISGIFNIFDSNNMSWFSQETKNQLDTTTPSRLKKGSESDTPLLDKQIQDIYDALGVKQP